MLGMNLELMSAIHPPPILSPHNVQVSRFRKVFHLSNHVISCFYHLILFKDDMGNGYVCVSISQGLIPNSEVYLPQRGADRPEV